MLICKQSNFFPHSEDVIIHLQCSWGFGKLNPINYPGFNFLTKGVQIS